jgi:hypothetical protein
MTFLVAASDGLGYPNGDRRQFSRAHCFARIGRPDGQAGHLIPTSIFKVADLGSGSVSPVQVPMHFACYSLVPNTPAITNAKIESVPRILNVYGLGRKMCRYSLTVLKLHTRRAYWKVVAESGEDFIHEVSCTQEA